jgi:hypothetical protein
MRGGNFDEDWVWDPYVVPSQFENPKSRVRIWKLGK